jgi:lipoprotein-anchoring transpeptidase ErfK/SrfK
MDHFVRFATGYSEPIGFHSVPRDNAGRLEQTKAQLGTPLSAGCVRQWMPDAVALWDFAPVGTKVVVTA